MEKIENITLEYLTIEDYQSLKSTMDEIYKPLADPSWQLEEIKKLIKIFPEGQVILKVNGQLAGCALSIIVNEKLVDSHHTYLEVTDHYQFGSHNKNGQILYGIDVFIKPEFRGLRLGRRLYDFRKDLCEDLNLKAIVFGGRIPKYHLYADQLSPKDYIRKVQNKEINDPVLNFQLSNDFRPIRILKNYLEGDLDSHDYAVLLQWNNIYYEKPSKKQPLYSKTIIRLGLVQWQMRLFQSVDDFLHQVEFFVDSLSGYKADFAVFPELFNAPLMEKYNNLSEPEAIRNLAQYSTFFVEKFSEMAIAYNINIVTGSMPEIVNEKLYNVGYLCHRDGRVDRYEKIHITPNEKSVWGMQGGDQLKVFDTDAGKVGILICYDAEFPELSRLLANEGMEILIIPFLTDTQNAYSRVRNCAQARAIENECYVAITGSIGNLPNVNNMDIQYAQSMVLTPCDFGFPANGIKAEATPNTEMVLVADVDLDLLRELNMFGSVNTIRDRRLDLYEIKRKKALK